MKDNEIQYSWLNFAQSFLGLAITGCDRIIIDQDRDTSCLFSGKTEDKKILPKDIFTPIVFNIKHGIEVFIKTLLVIKFNHHNKKYNIHNVEKLFKELIQNVSQEIKPIKFGGDEITQDNIDKIPSKLEEIRKYIFKYYLCNFINKGKKIINICDYENDVFRYPDNKSYLRVDDKLIDIDIINELKNDAIHIHDLFNELGYIFLVDKDYNDYLKEKK